MDAMKPALSEPRRVTVLGSTGSVGANTLDLLERNPGSYLVEALTANSNAALLAEQARRLKPRLAVVADERQYGALKSGLAGSGVEAAAGPEAVIEAAMRPSDWVWPPSSVPPGSGPRWRQCAGVPWWRSPTRNAWSPPGAS